MASRTPSTLAVPSATPKLAIWHFLLWMACVAVVAGWHHGSLAAITGSWPLQLQQILAGVSYYILAGLALSGLCLAAYCLVARKSYFPLSGGHWLLVIGGLLTLMGEAHNSVVDALHRADPRTHQVDYAYRVGTFSFALMGTAYLVAACRVRERWPWRVVFLGYASFSLFWGATYAVWTFANRDHGEQLVGFGRALQWPWLYLMLGGVTLLAGVDWYQRRQRDWLHWTGIAYIAAAAISQSMLEWLHWFVTN